MNQAIHNPKSLIVRPGADATGMRMTSNGLVLDCPLPWLAGPESQVLAVGTETIDADGTWLLRDGETLTGVLIGQSGVPLEAETIRLYRRMFALTRGLNRYRIWNRVPHINSVAAGEENYLAFNSGRHHAFIEEFGGIHRSDLTAASAVGTNDGALAIAFAAGPGRVEHYENPLQTPSENYSERYGHRPPLFARGSRIHLTDGASCWHLSGTASIRLSETVGGDFTSQLGITLENIERMLEVMAVPTQRTAAWKVFLRDRQDLAVCRQRLGEVYPGEVDQMLFVEADICRSDLLLEIEGHFHQSPSPSSPPNRSSP